MRLQFAFRSCRPVIPQILNSVRNDVIPEIVANSIPQLFDENLLSDA
jgi:hypothetical protein